MTRKSKREIEQTLDEIEESPPNGYPVIDNLAVWLSAEWECVDESENLYRREADGKVHYLAEGFEQAIEEAFFDGEEDSNE
jgi:hypothetical protein